MNEELKTVDEMAEEAEKKFGIKLPPEAREQIASLKRLYERDPEAMPPREIVEALRHTFVITTMRADPRTAHLTEEEIERLYQETTAQYDAADAIKH